MTLNIPIWGRDNAVCPYCNTLLTQEDVNDINFMGLMQLIAGKPALDVVDVNFRCPTCCTRLRVRFQQNQYGGQ